jgi:hypothetical protein
MTGKNKSKTNQEIVADAVSTMGLILVKTINEHLVFMHSCGAPVRYIAFSRKVRCWGCSMCVTKNETLECTFNPVNNPMEIGIQWGA